MQHKERIKQLRTDVDVLTLTATPIPRTLEMSLTGIRDLSLVQTPPEDRQPILTYVGEYDDRAASEAIRRELLREGQVFFVHNRVQRHRARRRPTCASSCPTRGSRSRTARWTKASSSGSCTEFWEREYDVLVCTTIVESGLDMPTVNTLVVDRADMLGLAQLYQLRGRVGRRGQRAYAYLLHPPDRALTEEAYERLKTIGEFTDLGSGFKIAMRDLEIRGAGNLLGAEQSGHIAAVGFDLYFEMVTEAVGELTGEVREVPDRSADRPADHRAPARATTSRATTCAWRRTAASRRSRASTTSTTSAPSGTTATDRRRRRRPRCSTSPGCASSAAPRRHRGVGAEEPGALRRARTEKVQEARLKRIAPQVDACCPMRSSFPSTPRTARALVEGLLALLAD